MRRAAKGTWEGMLSSMDNIKPGRSIANAALGIEFGDGAVFIDPSEGGALLLGDVPRRDLRPGLSPPASSAACHGKRLPTGARTLRSSPLGDPPRGNVAGRNVTPAVPLLA